MKEPVKKIKLDATLRKCGNGKIPNSLLVKLRGGGKLYAPAAAKYNAMYDAALRDGIKLRPLASGYRPLSVQESMFFDRYSSKPTLRVPKVTRKYQGKTWWLRRGKSPSATPGTSPHGWGLAQDINVQDHAVFSWLCANGPRFGFYLQGRRLLPNGKPNPEFEAWHWQYCGL